jgi:predicted ATPase/DNA-binding CsgD family transcriptional regulator
VDPGVSAREAEVLTLLGKHLTHAEIAATLVLSIRTVESHVASLRRKLGIAGHRELVRYAAERHGVRDVPLTSFVGRDRERADLRAAIHGARLVSLVGTGGVGKTRLAHVVAADLADSFPDGIWQVDLVPVADAVGLADAIASAGGFADLPGRSTEDAIVRGLSSANALLVLDNCEHVVNAVAVLTDRVLSRCPRLRVLVTSRVRLVLPFERVYPLGGLSPDDAVELFVARALSAGAEPSEVCDRDRVAAICGQLDHLALALELAAVHLPSLGVDGVERSLANQAGLLVGGARASPRQRSMHDTLAWSHRLLGPVEQAVLSRIAVFASGFDADAAVAVAGFGSVDADAVTGALGHLVDHSMLLPPAGRRWRMLEPVRQFGVAMMGETDQAAHLRHFEWVCARARSLMRASAMGGRAWYDGFDDIADELRAAVTWSPRSEASTMLATLLFGSGRLREAQARFEQAGDFADAAAVAKCRVQGEEALRLELADRDDCGARDDEAGYLAATARAAELIVRFEGMFAGPVASADVLLAELRDRFASAATVIELSHADPTDARSETDALRAADAAHEAGDLLRESAALDIATGAQIMAARPHDAAITAHRRLALFGDAVVSPSAVLELKDALRMGVLACVGVGDLEAALHNADRHRQLPALREQRDLGIDEALLPEVLAGRWDQARADADTFLADWDAAGRPAATGRAVGPAAVAMMYGLLGDDDARSIWLDVVASLRRADGTRGTAFADLFEAFVLVHRGLHREALALIATPSATWWAGLFERWRVALCAEAVAGRGGGDLLGRVRTAVASPATGP